MIIFFIRKFWPQGEWEWEIRISDLHAMRCGPQPIVLPLGAENFQPKFYLFENFRTAETSTMTRDRGELEKDPR